MIIIRIYNTANKIISTELNSKQKTFVRKNLSLKKEYGVNYNGFGYQDTVREYSPMNRSQMIQFNKLAKVKEVKPKTEKEKTLTWAKRLSKLVEINIEDAIAIAQEKIEYKESQINELEDRQTESPSKKRQALIDQIERSNPLRRIKDETHAHAIIVASERHSSNYENLLAEAKELAKIGEIEKSEVKDYARKNYKR